MSTKEVEEQVVKDGQQHSPQVSSAEGGACGGLDTLHDIEARFLNEKLQNLNIQDPSCENQTCSSKLETPTPVESRSVELPLSFSAVLSMPNVVFQECYLPEKYAESLASDNVSTISSALEFELKFVKCERVCELNRLLGKAIHRCVTMEKSNYDYFLNSLVSDSTQMTSEKLGKIAHDMHLRFESRRVLNRIVLCIDKNDRRLRQHSDRLSEAKSKYKRRVRKRKSKKGELDFLDEIEDIGTPLDELVARSLTALLNASKDILLPQLHKLGVLPENQLPDGYFFCGQTPQSIRENMALLDEFLSDSNDLLHYENAFNWRWERLLSAFDEFRTNSRQWMQECINLHNDMKPAYLTSSSKVRMLRITPSVTREEYDEMISEYIQVRLQHGNVKGMILRSHRLDMDSLERVSRELLRFSDDIRSESIFIAVLSMFLWLPTVSEVYRRFIEYDEMHLEKYISELTKLKIE